MSSSPPPTALKHCSKPWCIKTVPNGSKFYKACDSCREHDKLNQKARRAALKAGGLQKKVNKRKRAASTSSGGDGSHTLTETTTSDEEQDTTANKTSDTESSGDEGYKPRMPVQEFASAQSLYDALRAKFKGTANVSFHGSYRVPPDLHVSEKERVQMVAKEIWRVIGYRFTVRDNKRLRSGHRVRYWCSQDEARKKKSKSSTDPNIRNREHARMKRFPCRSQLSISCRHIKHEESDDGLVTVRLEHHHQHVHYVDVSMPADALQMIRDNLEWLTPTAMVTKVHAAFPNVTRLQIHTTWSEMSEVFWRREKEQLPSAKKLLEEYGEEADVFSPEKVPDGVEMLCWGMQKIAGPLKGKIVEVGVDATCE